MWQVNRVTMGSRLTSKTLRNREATTNHVIQQLAVTIAQRKTQIRCGCLRGLHTKPAIANFRTRALAPHVELVGNDSDSIKFSLLRLFISLMVP